MDLVLLGILLSAAVVYDYRERRIPNMLCLFGTGFGAVILCCLGCEELSAWLIHAVPCILFLFLLWRFQMLGGGDVKLFFMTSLYLREQTVGFVFTAAVVTAGYGLIRMLRQGSLFRRFFVFFHYVKLCVTEGRMVDYPFSTEEDKKEGGIPVSYGILIAYLLFLICGIGQEVNW